MTQHRSLLVLVAIGVVAVGLSSPIAAQETATVEGYDVTFGGTDEPLITGERMWLQLEIVDNETGEPVEDQADSVNVSVQHADRERTELVVNESHSEPGVYEAGVIFTEPGEYTVHVEGSIEDTEIHTHFETQVADHTEFEYPGNESNATDDEPTDIDEPDETQTGILTGVGLAGLVVLLLGAHVWARRR